MVDAQTHTPRVEQLYTGIFWRALDDDNSCMWVGMVHHACEFAQTSGSVRHAVQGEVQDGRVEVLVWERECLGQRWDTFNYTRRGWSIGQICCKPC